MAGYGIGPKKMSEHFCYIALNEDYVNFGFNQGADLPDPKGLLEGSGKMPHQDSRARRPRRHHHRRVACEVGDRRRPQQRDPTPTLFVSFPVQDSQT